MISMRLSSRIPASGARLLPLALIAAGALAACADDPAPQFEPEGTGTVSGIVFFDRDNNGTFSPVGGDTALRGVEVELRNRGTSDVISHGPTDAEGRFTLLGPVGTHDIFVAGNAAFTSQRLVYCGGARPTLYRGEQTFLPVPIKTGCVIRINAAKALGANANVTVAGIVTARPGRLRSQGDNLYIQDPTGGIQVFGNVGALNLQEGDSIEVSGSLTLFNAELEVVSPVIAPNVRRGAAVPAPAQRTTAQVAAVATTTNPDLGRLLVVRRVRVGAFASGNATMNDGSGGATLRLAGATLTSIGTARFAASQCYDVTGILSTFNNSPQLLPRGPEDVREVTCP
jgi:hypothetical protein